MNKVFEVKVARKITLKEHQVWTEHFVASHIQKVIDELELDLKDGAAEVLSIREVCPNAIILP